MIDSGAAAAGLTRASYMARAAVAAARDAEHTAAALAEHRDVLAEFFAARRNLIQAGTLLNQVAKVLNSGGDNPHTDTAKAAVEQAAARLERSTAALITILDPSQRRPA